MGQLGLGLGLGLGLTRIGRPPLGAHVQITHSIMTMRLQ